MRILFLGDIVGRPGRQAVKDNLSAIREAENIDLALPTRKRQWRIRPVSHNAKALSVTAWTADFGQPHLEVQEPLEHA